MADSLYLALFGAHNGVGALARAVGRSRYTHAAIAFSPDLDEFVSFARRRLRWPMDAGFMRETRACQAGPQDRDFAVKVFEIPAEAKELARVHARVDAVERDPAYVFNLFSAITVQFGRRTRIPKAHTCLTFSGELLAHLAAAGIPEDYEKFTVADYDSLLSGYAIYEGRLPVTGPAPAGYFDQLPAWRNLPLGAALIGTLLRRAWRNMAGS